MIAGCSKGGARARIRRVIEGLSDNVREGFHPDANRNIVWILIPAGTTTMSLDLLKSTPAGYRTTGERDVCVLSRE